MWALNLTAGTLSGPTQPATIARQAILRGAGSVGQRLHVTAVAGADSLPHAWHGASLCAAQAEAQDVEVPGAGQEGAGSCHSPPHDDQRSQPQPGSEPQQYQVAGHLHSASHL